MEFDFLIQKEKNLSPKESEKNLSEVLTLLNIKLNSSNKKNALIQLQNNNDKKILKSFKYLDLLNEIRDTGVCELHDYIDNLDPIYDYQFSPDTNGSFIEMTIEWEGYRKTVKGPGRISPSEWELSDDIEFYKNETCIEANQRNENFSMATRNYRGYIFSSIALIDSYINRHIKYNEAKNFKSEEFDKLRDSRKMEERIELFLNIFSDISIQELKQTREWNDFKKLKNLRNQIIHSTEPYMGISLEEIAENLNFSILGVGGLLRRFQISQSKHTLKFIEKVRNSAPVHYQYKYSDKKGNIKVKSRYFKISRG